MLGWALNLGFAASPPGLVTVPDVVGETQAQATTDITALGLTASVTSAYSSTVAAGLVVSQVPTGGSQVAPGSDVAIVVSLGPQPVQAGGIGQIGGGGGSIDYQSHKPGKPRLRKQIDEILDSAEAAYRALRESPQAEAAAKIVKPFTEDKRAAVPPVQSIDWIAVERDVTRTRRLLALAARLKQQREIDEDDEEIMFFH